MVHDSRNRLTQRAAVPLIVIALLVSGFPGAVGDDQAREIDVCPAGCAYEAIQPAVDQAAAGDAILVKAGSYQGAVDVPAAKNGLQIIGEDGAQIHLDGAPLSIASDEVLLYGFTLQRNDDGPVVQVDADDVVLRGNQIDGELAVTGSRYVDARLNHWGTDLWSQVLHQIMAPAGSVAASPILLADGTQDPPAPTVEPASHCDSMGLDILFFEHAVWCAHAGGVIVLHPSQQVPPTPHAVVRGTGDNPDANIIHRNRELVSVHPVTGIPTWEPFFTGDTELLTGLAICSGGPKDDAAEPPSPSPGADCVDDPEGVIVDAGAGTGDNSPLRHTLDIQADDVTVSGLTIQYTTDQQDRHGIILRGDGATLIASRVVGNFLPHEHDGGTTVHQMGVEVPGADALVEDNEIGNWRNIGLFVTAGAGEENRVLENQILQSRWHGILIEGPRGASPTLYVEANTIDEHGFSAIRFGSADTAGYQVRDNVLGPLNQNAVTVQSGVSSALIDVRLNDWSLYDHRLLPARVVDDGSGNQVLQVPFLDPSGVPEPGLPTNTDGSHSSNPATCNAHPHADWDAASGSCRYLSIQGAVDFAHPGGTVLVPGSSNSAAPTPYLENVHVGQNSLGETLDGLVLCSSATGSGCDGDADRTRIDGAATGQPALHVDDANDVSVSGLTLQGSSPAARATDAASLSFAGNTVESVISATSSQQGLHVSGSDGATFTGNRFIGNLYPGSMSLNVVDSDNVVISDNKIQAAGTGIRVAESTGAALDTNQIVQPGSGATGSDTLGISLHRGSGHSTQGNVIHGAGIGITVGSSPDVTLLGDHFLATRTGVRVAAPVVSEQPSGLTIENADLSATTTGVHLASQVSMQTVEATCNDWGVYTAGGIQEKIRDDSGTNTVNFVPFISPDSSDGAFECLALPQVALDGPGLATKNEDARFNITVTSDRPIVERQWDFGDGDGLDETPPFPASVTHAYDTPGSFVVVVVARDSEGAEGAAATVVEVLPEGPQIVAPDSLGASVDDPLSFVAHAFTVDAQVVDLTAAPLPSGASLVEDDEPGRWLFAWTPLAHQVGTHTIGLTATSADGGTALHSLEITVAGEPAERQISLLRSTQAPHAVSPGEAVNLTAQLRNLGGSTVEVALSAGVGKDWMATTDEGTIVLAGGATVQVPLDVLVGDGSGTARAVLRADVLGDPDGGLKVSWFIEAPLVAKVEMNQTNTGSPITGVVKVTFPNGAPASGVAFSATRSNGFDVVGVISNSFSGVTDSNGLAEFAFPATNLAAQVPGTHVISLVAESSGQQYRGHLSYRVSV